MPDSGSSRPVAADCVIADNDLSTDDLMAVPAIMGTRPVVAIVQTEGVSRAPQATSAAEMLVSQSPSERRAGRRRALLK
jgi:inosine-uridine nucleoside N-ribohydrolase